MDVASPYTENGLAQRLIAATTDRPRRLARLQMFVHASWHDVVVRNTAWNFVGRGGLAVIQAMYFVIIARQLGPGGYGAFVGVAALVAIISPFVGFGAINLLVKNVSRNQDLFAEYWGNALLMNAVSGLAMLPVVLVVARLILPATVPILLILPIAITDLLLYRIASCGAVAFQAFERLGMMAKLNLLTALFRLAAAGVLALLVKNPGPVAWAYLYMASTAASVVVTLAAIHRTLGRPRLALHRIRPELAEGCYFSISLSAENIYNDIDKTALARLATLGAAGIYAAAYRIIDVVFTPVAALVSATFPRFFQRGSSGLSGSMQYAKRLIPRAGAYALAALLGTIVFAPFVPSVLGAHYANVVEALRWLAPLPLLRSFHYFLGNSLTGAGFQGTRSAMQVLVALVNIGLDVWLIPTYSWRGAAWASLASDSLLVVCFAVAIFYWLHRPLKSSEVAESQLAV